MGLHLVTTAMRSHKMEFITSSLRGQPCLQLGLFPLIFLLPTASVWSSPDPCRTINASWGVSNSSLSSSACTSFLIWAPRNNLLLFNRCSCKIDLIVHTYKSKAHSSSFVHRQKELNCNKQGFPRGGIHLQLVGIFQERWSKAEAMWMFYSISLVRLYCMNCVSEGIPGKVFWI